jgi:hypothetical protein
MPPHQRAKRRDAHQRPAEHRQPGRRHVDEHDLYGRALLIVVGRDEQCEIKPDGEQECRQPGEPRHQPVRKIEEAGWIGEIDESHWQPS